MLIPPPPQSGEPAAERPKGKLPWSKPQIRVIEVNFTGSGFNPRPNQDEVNDGDGDIGPPGGTYRVS